MGWTSLELVRWNGPIMTGANRSHFSCDEKVSLANRNLFTQIVARPGNIN